MALATNEYRITENDSNTTLTAGVVNTLTKIIQWSCPNSTGFEIRPGDVFSLTAKDTAGPTDIADTSLIKVVITDPNEIYSQVILEGSYAIVKEFTNRNTIYAFSSQYKIGANQLVQVWVNGDLAVATAQTVFQISGIRITSGLPV
jgi:hypothetical protein